MNRLSKLFHLTALDREILVNAAILLWAVRIGLWILPFQKLRELLAKRAPKSLPAGDAEPALIAKICHYVRILSRYVPSATCLAQALVTVTLMQERGLPACLQIGVAKSKSGKLEAHAWVESQGRVIIGGAHVDLARFTLLHSVEGT